MSRPSMSPALSVGDTKIKTGDTRYRGRIAKSERPRDEYLEVLADHSTDGRDGAMVLTGKVGN